MNYQFLSEVPKDELDNTVCECTLYAEVRGYFPVPVTQGSLEYIEASARERRHYRPTEAMQIQIEYFSGDIELRHVP